MSSTGFPPLDNTIGCLFLSSIFSMGLWGAGSLQTFYYFDKYKNDALWLKLLVTVVWILDTTHQGLVVAAVYRYLISNYGGVQSLLFFEPALKHTVIFTNLICGLVQALFVTRIYHVSRKSIVATTIPAILVLAQFVSGTVYYVKEFHFTSLVQLASIFAVTRTINVITAVTDTVIALILVFYLHTSRTGIRQTDSMLNRLILFAVNTGLITSICAVVGLITGLTLPTTFVYITFYECLARLYMNSMMASLNSRQSIKGQLYSNDQRAISMADDANTAPNRVNLNIMNSKADGSNMRNAVTVTVERESFEEASAQKSFGYPSPA